MFGAIILIEEENREFHNLEVNHEVPEDDRVLGDEHILGQHRVATLCESVNELFVEGTWRQKVHGHAFSSVYILRAILRLDEELGHKLLLAVRALDDVVRLVLREQTEELFLAERLLAVLTLLLQLDVERALQHLTHLDGLLLQLERGVVGPCRWLVLLKQVVEVVIILTSAPKCSVVLILGLDLLPLLGLLLLASVGDLLEVLKRDVVALTV